MMKVSFLPTAFMVEIHVKMDPHMPGSLPE